LTFFLLNRRSEIPMDFISRVRSYFNRPKCSTICMQANA